MRPESQPHASAQPQSPATTAPSSQPGSQPTSQPTARNRLAQAASPYLLQHADNPVDWHEWNAATLALARQENKPIFLSIGYAACHWCHVMAHESFEDAAIAAELNRYFVNIKVDREERPDIDDLYMQATQIVNRGQGGWPMSVWLTPDLKPFYAGTYFPPESRWGRPGFIDVVRTLGEAWQSDRDNVLKSAEKLTELMRSMNAGQLDPDEAPAATGATSQPPASSAPALPGPEVVERTAALLTRAFDAQRGGMSGGGTNKFPPSMALDLFMRTIVRARPDDAARAQRLTLLTLTLDRMAAGGIYDQLAGGIHRYSTDVDWLAPHFEKMLYDQALVSRGYVDAYQLTGRPSYARVARDIFDYVLGDLTSPKGGFYSTRDADSEGEEGRYYVWTRAEVLKILGPEVGPAFCEHYDVSDRGNWDDPHAPGTAKTILRVAAHQLDEAAHARFAAARAKLEQVRRTRVPPGLDDKVLCEWNGLMIAALARGGAALGERRYVDAAASAAEFLFAHQYRDGRLLRSSRGERRLEAAFLTDYAALTEGCIELYEATFERRWYDRAMELAETTLRLFEDAAGGGFYFTSHDHEALLLRNKDIRDSATPSGNSLMFMNLLRLSLMSGQERFRAAAERLLRAFAPMLNESPWTAERLVSGVDFAFGAPLEIAVVGPLSDARTQALLRVVRETYLPNRIIMQVDPAARSQAGASPLLESRDLVDGRPAIYLCRNYTCKLPITEVEELRQALMRP